MSRSRLRRRAAICSLVMWIVIFTAITVVAVVASDDGSKAAERALALQLIVGLVLPLLAAAAGYGAAFTWLSVNLADQNILRRSERLSAQYVPKGECLLVQAKLDLIMTKLDEIRRG